MVSRMDLLPGLPVGNVRSVTFTGSTAWTIGLLNKVSLTVLNNELGPPRASEPAVPPSPTLLGLSRKVLDSSPRSIRPDHGFCVGFPGMACISTHDSLSKKREFTHIEPYTVLTVPRDGEKPPEPPEKELPNQVNDYGEPLKYGALAHNLGKSRKKGRARAQDDKTMGRVETRGENRLREGPRGFE
ncbi:hypothetical protein M407DRAFT_8093 [Tulasnella calospora MUT 4182]|uniref:Uncharacterized protein n=1 Tax=Tulasnella calospora MUT 4182 TaxID=1051891 RepID=A0A0C3QIY6_9AGAM|nr:hypothetical protein M407DRAFT_8093 [Tulasnella calospora MUT 4182]